MFVAIAFGVVTLLTAYLMYRGTAAVKLDNSPISALYFVCAGFLVVGLMLILFNPWLWIGSAIVSLAIIILDRV